MFHHHVLVMLLAGAGIAGGEATLSVGRVPEAGPRLRVSTMLFSETRFREKAKAMAAKLGDAAIRELLLSGKAEPGVRCGGGTSPR